MGAANCCGFSASAGCCGCGSAPAPLPPISPYPINPSLATTNSILPTPSPLYPVGAPNQGCCDCVNGNGCGFGCQTCYGPLCCGGLGAGVCGVGGPVCCGPTGCCCGPAHCCGCTNGVGFCGYGAPAGFCAPGAGCGCGCAPGTAGCCGPTLCCAPGSGGCGVGGPNCAGNCCYPCCGPTVNGPVGPSPYISGVRGGYPGPVVGSVNTCCGGCGFGCC